VIGQKSKLIASQCTIFAKEIPKTLLSMKRFAFKMYLKPGCENEYAKRHAAIWPELKKQLVENQGISNYSIFWDKETNVLFCLSGVFQRHKFPSRSRCHHSEMVEYDGRHYGYK